MNKKPLDYQTILKLPVKESFKYGYGLLNNVIHLDIPVKKNIKHFAETGLTKWVKGTTSPFNAVAAIRRK